jgi:hypothetical protein
VWETEIRPLFPATYQEQARRLGAWTRTRGIPAIDALLQALLCYVLCARSLRQLGAWAPGRRWSAWAPSRTGPGASGSATRPPGPCGYWVNWYRPPAAAALGRRCPGASA